MTLRATVELRCNSGYVRRIEVLKSEKISRGEVIVKLQKKSGVGGGPVWGSDLGEEGSGWICTKI